MRYVLTLTVALFSVGLAHAEWPFTDAPAKAWPFEKSCDCAPCTCDPAKCTCPNCDAGCKKTGSAAPEQVAFVGSDPFQTTTVETPVASTPQGYHVEYRRGACSGSSCPLVPVMVRDVTADQQYYTMQPPDCANGTCSTGTCATGNCATGNCGSGCSSGSCGSQGGCSSGSCGRSGPIRRIIGRLRHR